MISQFVETLRSYTDEHWLRYVFGREPLVGKLGEKQKSEFYNGAKTCAKEQADLLRKRRGHLSVPALAEKENVKVKFDETATDGLFTTFATHSEEDGITIYADNARATDLLIEREGLAGLTGGVKTADLLIAHELFHHVESRTPDIYTLRKHILLFRIGPFENRSRLVCLGEAAAMEFARELTGLAFSPYIFDVLMLYAKNPQRAGRQFDMIQKICEGDPV